MTTPPADAFVFFGATGDFAYKQIFPALQALIRRGRFNMPIVGVAKAGWNLEQFRARARTAWKSTAASIAPSFAKLCARLQYVDGDYADAATFSRSGRRLARPSSRCSISRFRPACSPPSPKSWRRRLHERRAWSWKNRSAAISRRLRRSTGRCSALPRESDLSHRSLSRQGTGAEPVYFRFANPLSRPAWINEHVESVQITMAEKFGVAGRGKFYEEAGASATSCRITCCKWSRAWRWSAPGKGHEACAMSGTGAPERGPHARPVGYRAGTVSRDRVEPGVAANSRVETFAALRLQIDNDRWRGVPFYVRVGKVSPRHRHRSVGSFQTAVSSRARRPRADTTESLSLQAQSRSGLGFGRESEESGRIDGW